MSKGEREAAALFLYLPTLARARNAERARGRGPFPQQIQSSAPAASVAKIPQRTRPDERTTDRPSVVGRARRPPGSQRLSQWIQQTAGGGAIRAPTRFVGHHRQRIKERDLANPQIPERTHDIDETMDLTIGPSVEVDPVPPPTTPRVAFDASIFADARACEKRGTCQGTRPLSAASGFDRRAPKLPHSLMPAPPDRNRWPAAGVLARARETGTRCLTRVLPASARSVGLRSRPHS